MTKDEEIKIGSIVCVLDNLDGGHETGIIGAVLNRAPNNSWVVSANGYPFYHKETSLRLATEDEAKIFKP